jgi:hypothetical protein
MKSNQKLSVQKYFKTRVRKLPLHECFINKQYKESGLAQILISRKQASGKYVYVVFLLDVFCLGLKNVMFNFNFNKNEYEEMKHQLFQSEPFIPIDIVDAHNLIFGIIDIEEDIGFKPHKDFAIAEYILDTDLINDGIDEIEIGKNGKPLFIAGPHDNVKRIIKILDRTLGKDGYEFMQDVDF